MVTNTKLNVKFETHDITVNTILEAMQNIIKAILEELKYLCTAQVRLPIQNI